MKKKLMPKFLGKVSNTPTRDLDVIEWGEATPPPNWVELDCSEFTSHCPVTGQPDFARIKIVYHPDAHLVETKSLKLFLWTFRDVGQFNERLVDEIAQEFFNRVKPKWVSVEGAFHQRGGISVTARCRRDKGVNP